MKAQARREAEQAVHNGSYGLGAGSDPLWILWNDEHPNELIGAEDILLRAIRAGTEFPYVHVHECRFLIEVGRPREAMPHCERAMALRPLPATTGWSYASALSGLGWLARAREVADLTLRFNPDSLYARQIRFEIDAFQGSPDAARAVLRAPAPAAQLGSPAVISALDEVLAARKSRSRAAADRALADLQAAASDRNSLRYLVFAAAMFGRPETAFGALAPGLDMHQDPSILLEPAAAPLRSDPRFWSAAARAGYVTYWRTRGWPDFCTAAGNTVDCVGMAAAARPKG